MVTCWFYINTNIGIEKNKHGSTETVCAVGCSLMSFRTLCLPVYPYQTLSLSEGATFALPEAAGATSAANRFREREAAEAEGSR